MTSAAAAAMAGEGAAAALENRETENHLKISSGDGGGVWRQPSIGEETLAAMAKWRMQREEA